jgi:membrane fusion protein (multidrug efflux system)
MTVIFPVSERTLIEIRRNFGAKNDAELTAIVKKDAVLQLRLSDGSIYGRTGVINFTDNAVVAATDSVRLKGEFPNPLGVLKQGQSVTVIISTKKKTSRIIIPQSAIMSDIGGKYIFMLDDANKVHRRDIEVGALLPDGRQVILSGIEIGEKIITTGIQKARPGITVNAMSEQEYSDTIAPRPGGTAGGM